MRSMTRLLSLALLTASTVAAHAFPLTYTLSGTMSGTLNGVAFTDSLVTFSETEDTTNVTLNSFGDYLSFGGTATFSIAGVGSGTVTSPTFGLESQPQSASFMDTGNGFILGIFSHGNPPGLENYDLQSALGPITATFDSSLEPTVATSDGVLSILGPTEPGGLHTAMTFSAVAQTPEPSSLALLGTGVVGLVGAARRRFSV